MLNKHLVGLSHKVRHVCGGFPKSHNVSSKYYKVVVQSNHQHQLYPMFGIVRNSSTNTFVPHSITKAIEASSNTAESSPNPSVVESLINSIGPIPEPPVPPAPKLIEYLANGEPSLESLGLAAFTPSGLIQRVLEYVHVTGDLSWATTIVLAAMRMLLFKVVIGQRKESMKVAAFAPQVTFLQQKITEARAQNDIIQVSRYALELNEFEKTHQKPGMLGVLKYAVVQGFVLLSFTQALRGMCYLPVESMKTGGFLSFVDLTIKDPSLILPAANACVFFLHLVTNKDLYRTAPHRRGLIQVAMGAGSCVMFFVTSSFPSAIVLFWVSSLSITAMQHKVLDIPAVKTYYGLNQTVGNERLTELMKNDRAKKGQFSLKGIMKNWREARANSRIAQEISTRAQLDSAAFERAGREPIRKTYKYNVAKVNKK